MLIPKYNENEFLKKQTTGKTGRCGTKIKNGKRLGNVHLVRVVLLNSYEILTYIIFESYFLICYIQKMLAEDFYI